MSLVDHRQSPDPDDPASLACIILAHADPTHVRRRVAALDPFPIFLHCGASTAIESFHAMTTDLPERCTVMERTCTGWAKWQNVEAEMSGYRAVLQSTSASHVALLTGTDYPLASAEAIRSVLERSRGRSMAEVLTLPHPQWRAGGFPRLRYRHWAYHKHMLRLPLPRCLPQDVVFAGGSQLEILASSHASALLDANAADPGLAQFWRRSWIADETYVPSILSTSRFVPNWAEDHVNVTPWWIGWDGSRQKSPPWLRMEHWTALRACRTFPAGGMQPLFARKFSTAYSTEVLDAIDKHLRAGGDGTHEP